MIAKEITVRSACQGRTTPVYNACRHGGPWVRFGNDLKNSQHFNLQTPKSFRHNTLAKKLDDLLKTIDMAPELR